MKKHSDPVEEDKELTKDVLLCHVMAVWAEISTMETDAVMIAADSDVRKALLIAKTALELSIKQLTEKTSPVCIKRINNDYIEYLRSPFDPRD